MNMRYIVIPYLVLNVLGCTASTETATTETDVSLECTGPEGWFAVQNQTDQTAKIVYEGYCSGTEHEAVLEPYETSRFEGGKGDKSFTMKVESPAYDSTVFSHFDAGEVITLRWYGNLLVPEPACTGPEGFVTIENQTDQTVYFNLAGRCSALTQFELEPHGKNRFGGAKGDEWFDVTIASVGGTVARRLEANGSYALRWRGDVLDVFPEP